jgi:hypothetical protein
VVLETEAREARKGLWADPQPVPPWESGGSLGEVVPLSGSVVDHMETPPSEPVREGLSDEDMLALSQHVLRDMVRLVREDGTIPLVVHFPYQFELKKAAENGNNYIPFSVQTLRNAGIDHFDMTACLLEAKAADEYMLWGHYSPTANAVIAKCLESIVAEGMGRLKQ